MCQRRVGKERQPAHLTSGVVLQTFGRDPQIGEDAAVSWPKAAEEGEDQERSEWSIAGEGRVCLVGPDVAGGMGGLEFGPIWIANVWVRLLLTTHPSRPKVVIGLL